MLSEYEALILARFLRWLINSYPPRASSLIRHLVNRTMCII